MRRPAADHHAETRITEGVGPSQQHQALAGSPKSGPPHDCAKLPGALQALPPGQAKAKSAPLGHTARRDVPAASGGKPFASLLPPPVEYLTTAAGSHPRAESVVALAPNYAWLISAFHDECCSAWTAPKRRNIVRQDGARVKEPALFVSLFVIAKTGLAPALVFAGQP